MLSSVAPLGKFDSHRRLQAGGVQLVFASLQVVSVQAAHPQPRRGEVGGGGEGARPAPHLPALEHHVGRLEGEGEAPVSFDLPCEGAGVVIEDVLLHSGVNTRAHVPPQSSVDAAGP